MLVIRAEESLVSDLESIFKDVYRNFCRPEGVLPPGSVILIGTTGRARVQKTDYGWQNVGIGLS